MGVFMIPKTRCFPQGKPSRVVPKISKFTKAREKDLFDADSAQI